MSAHQSEKVIYAALVENSLIAVCKFIADNITGSGSSQQDAIIDDLREISEDSEDSEDSEVEVLGETPAIIHEQNSFQG